MMYGNWWGGAGMLLMVLFWVFVIALAVWLVLALGRTQARSGDGAPPPALRILEERFARGEIDAEEFRTRRAAITEGKS